jgi:hypothetical protein
MNEVELNGDLIAEYIEERELYGVAQMIRRQGDQGNDEAGEPRTYLGTALIGRAEDNRGQVFVTGSTAVPEGPRLPASSPWASDPVPMEEPLGFSIEEVGALGGAGGSHESMSGRVEIAVPASHSGEGSGER